MSGTLTLGSTPRGRQPIEELRAGIAMANEVRVLRAARKAAWKADPAIAYREAAESVAGPGWWMQHATVRQVLGWLPRMGPAAVRRVAAVAGVPEGSDPELVELSRTQREKLVNVLRYHLERVEGELAASA